MKNIEKLRYLSNLIEKAATVDAPKLRNIDAFIEVSVIEIDSKKSEAIVTCKAEFQKKIIPVFRPYCRGMLATIETIIHATRIQAFRKKDHEGTVKRLIKLVQHYHDLIKRVAPTSEYSKIVNEIVASIENFK